VERARWGKRLRDAQKSILAVDATSPAPSPNRPDETTSRTSSPSAANTFNTPASKFRQRRRTEESRSENPSAQSLNVRPEDSVASLGLIGPSLAITDDDPSLIPIIPKPVLERNCSAVLIARNAPLRVSPKPTHSPKAVGPTSGVPRNPASRRLTLGTRATPHLSWPFRNSCHWPRRWQQTVSG